MPKIITLINKSAEIVIFIFGWCEICPLVVLCACVFSKEKKEDFSNAHWPNTWCVNRGQKVPLQWKKKKTCAIIIILTDSILAHDGN